VISTRLKNFKIVYNINWLESLKNVSYSMIAK
jgi:hypothetical protein